MESRAVCRCAVWALAAAFIGGGCAPEDKKAGLVVAVQTDMSIPKDVDAVKIEVSAYGRVMFDQKYAVGKDGLHIPATITLLPPDQSSTPVTLKVSSYQGKDVRTLRRVVTTVPDTREALLRMPISWLCEGQAKKSGDDVVSTCKEGSSCVAGECVTDEVDSAGLSDFASSTVFGGAALDESGTCFDTAPCFANNVPASELGLDPQSCTLSLEQSVAAGLGGSGNGTLDPDELNFAIATPSAGICGDWGCFVPLERDQLSGWHLEGTTVHLPQAVCSKLAEGEQLVLSTACAAREPSTPPCGDWTGIEGSAITVPLDELPEPTTGGGGGASTGGSDTGGSGTGGSDTGGSDGSGGQSASGGITGGGGSGVGGTGGGTAGTGGIGAGGAVGTGGGTSAWVMQFGTAVGESGNALAMDGVANLYFAGTTGGDLAQTSLGGIDAVVRKVDPAGTEVWTTQFGSLYADNLTAIGVDSQDSVYVAGYTSGVLPGQSSDGGTDSFVAKLDSTGAVLWIRQFGAGEDFVQALTVAPDGTVYVVGRTSGNLVPGKALGGSDAFVRQYDTAGNVLFTEQFGTAQDDTADAVTVDIYGFMYVAGTTEGAMPTQALAGFKDAYVRMYNTSSNTADWTHQLGTTAADYGTAVVADALGDIFLVGYTEGLLGASSAGYADVFVRKLDFQGTTYWTQQTGTLGSETTFGAAIDPNGKLFVVGKTDAAFANNTNAGGEDSFILMFDTDGSEKWQYQFGSTKDDVVQGVCLDAAQNVFVAGQVLGALPGQTSQGSSDAFLACVVPPPIIY